MSRAALGRLRDTRVVDQQVETADFPADALRRGGDRIPVGHIKLERDGAWANFLRRSLAEPEIPRPDQHGQAVRGEFLRDLKTDSLIGAGDQRNAIVVHTGLPGATRAMIC
jgi:hypothetical protein